MTVLGFLGLNKVTVNYRIIMILRRNGENSRLKARLQLKTSQLLFLQLLQFQSYSYCVRLLLILKKKLNRYKSFLTKTNKECKRKKSNQWSADSAIFHSKYYTFKILLRIFQLTFYEIFRNINNTEFFFSITV